MIEHAVSDYAAYELLLGYLSPADHASLRLVSRSWQALVDRSLGCLYPSSITPCNFGFGSATSLVYKSLFQSSIIRHHALDSRPVNGFHAIARQFTALHTLAVDCISRSCDDFEHLHLITGLRRLKLSQFEFSDEAFEFGIATCGGLQVLHLECQKATLHVGSLRHLSGLTQLQELCLKPRGYINVPAEAAIGIAALGNLTKLTQLVLSTALRPLRTSSSSSSSSDAGGNPFAAHIPDLSTSMTAGQPVYFDTFTTQRLSGSLSKMRGLQVLRIAAPAAVPAAVGTLTHLRELSIERVGNLTRAAVVSLLPLKQLTALTLIVAAEPSDIHAQQQQQQQHWQAVDPVAGVAAAGIGAAAGALGMDPQQQQQQHVDLDGNSSSGGSRSVDSLFLPLIQLPNLQELVVGCIARGQTLNLYTTLTHDLHPPACKETSLQGFDQQQGIKSPSGPLASGFAAAARQGFAQQQQQQQQRNLSWGLEHQGPHSQGSRGPYGRVLGRQGSRSSSGSRVLHRSACGQCSTLQQQQQQGLGNDREQKDWFFQGLGGERYLHDEGGAASAYVCPDQWSLLADMEGLQHVVVEARGWHSAAVTARYNSVGEAVSSMMTWPSVGPLDPLAAAAAAGAGSTSSRGAWLQQQPCSSGNTGLLAGLAHMVGFNNNSSSSGSIGPRLSAAADLHRWNLSDHQQHQWSNLGSKSAAAKSAAPLVSYGAVGVFINHPSQQGYLPGLPQLLVLALRPGMGQLGLVQQRLVQQHLMAVQRAGLHAAQQQLLLGGTVPLPESPARQLLLAQLRASMHPSKLLIVLAASATHIRRLEVTVDQSWPPAVLSSLGHLQKLPHLEILKLDCGRQDPPPEMWTGLSGLTNLRWLCLRWLEALPVSCLAGMSKLVVLQLKAISNPPGAAELAEVMAGMPDLQALAIEGGLLDVEGDWLRDTAGLLRHGRWTSSWVEHTLCRQQRLRVLGSITAALLMAVILNSPKLPEMIITAVLAAISGTIFVLAVAASLVSLMLDPVGPTAAAAAGEDAAAAAGAGFSWQQLQQQASGLLRTSSAAATAAGLPAVSALAAAEEPLTSSSSSRGYIGTAIAWMWWLSKLYFWIFFWPVWLWFVAVRYCSYAVLCYCCRKFSLVRHNSSSSSSVEGIPPSAAAEAEAPADQAVDEAGAGAAAAAAEPPAPEEEQQQQQTEQQQDSAEQQQQQQPDEHDSSSEVSDEQDRQQHNAAAAAAKTAVTDPGAAFRRLRYFSLRRCTLTGRTRTALISNQPLQLTSLMTQLPPGLWSQLVAAFLGLLLWPLAALGALSRIVASSSYQAAGAAGGLWSGLSHLGLVGLRSQGFAVGGSSGPGSNPSRRGRGLFAGWGWYWDELCVLLQAAANKVEVAAVGHGSALLGLVGEMPNLRFLDVTWLNLEPWELHGLVQLKQLHYLGLGKQQIGVVLSAEAQLARNLQRGWRGRGRRRNRKGRARGLSGALGGWDSLLITPFLWLRWCWFAGPWTWWFNSYNSAATRGGVGHGTGRGPGMGLPREFEMCWLDDGGSSMIIVEAPAGLDEVLERDIMA